MINYVYVLENEFDQSLYIGYTGNLRRRFKQHNNGQGGEYTKRKEGWKLIYFEWYLNKKDALDREKFLKGGSGRKYINRQLRNYFMSQ